MSVKPYDSATLTDTVYVNITMNKLYVYILYQNAVQLLKNITAADMPTMRE